jgi:hypothetical protein
MRRPPLSSGASGALATRRCFWCGRDSGRRSAGELFLQQRNGAAKPYKRRAQARFLSLKVGQLLLAGFEFSFQFL